MPGSSLECGFALDRDMMTISVSVQCLAPEPPASDTFAWTVLSALAGSVEAHVGPGDLLTIVMRKTREIIRISMTGEIEVTLTEEFESTVVAAPGAGRAPRTPTPRWPR